MAGRIVHNSVSLWSLYEHSIRWFRFVLLVKGTDSLLRNLTLNPKPYFAVGVCGDPTFTNSIWAGTVPEKVWIFLGGGTMKGILHWFRVWGSGNLPDEHHPTACAGRAPNPSMPVNRLDQKLPAPMSPSGATLLPPQLNVDSLDDLE